MKAGGTDGAAAKHAAAGVETREFRLSVVHRQRRCVKREGSARRTVSGLRPDTFGSGREEKVSDPCGSDTLRETAGVRLQPDTSGIDESECPASSPTPEAHRRNPLAPDNGGNALLTIGSVAWGDGDGVRCD